MRKRNTHLFSIILVAIVMIAIVMLAERFYAWTYVPLPEELAAGQITAFAEESRLPLTCTIVPHGFWSDSGYCTEISATEERIGVRLLGDSDVFVLRSLVATARKVFLQVSVMAHSPLDYESDRHYVVVDPFQPELGLGTDPSDPDASDITIHMYMYDVCDLGYEVRGFDYLIGEARAYMSVDVTAQVTGNISSFWLRESTKGAGPANITLFPVARMSRSLTEEAERAAARLSGQIIDGILKNDSVKGLITRKTQETSQAVDSGTARSESRMVLASKQSRPPKAHSRYVRSVAFSPDGSLLATAGRDTRDSTMKLWELPEGKLRATLKGHVRSVNCLAFSPDGTVLASGADDCATMLWRPSDGQLLATLVEGCVRPVWSIAFSADGNQLVSAGHEIMKLWRLPGEKLQTTLSDPEWVSNIALSPDGKLLAASTLRETIKLWTFPSGTLQATLKDEQGGYGDSIGTIAFSPDGDILASGDGSWVKLWTFPQGELQAKLMESLSSNVSALAFSGDGTLLASGDHHAIRLWELPACRLKAKFLDDNGASSLAFSPNGRLLASGNSSGYVFLWDLEADNCQWVLFDPDAE